MARWTNSAYSSSVTTHAGGAAQADLVLEARARAVVHDRVGAVPEGHDPVQVRQGAPQGARARERAEVTRPPALLADLGRVRAHVLQPREAIAQVDPQHPEGLVVLEPDVVGRLVLLDEGVLEQQRLLLGPRHQQLDGLRLLPRKRIRIRPSPPAAGSSSDGSEVPGLPRTGPPVRAEHVHPRPLGDLLRPPLRSSSARPIARGIGRADPRAIRRRRLRRAARRRSMSATSANCTRARSRF